MANTARRPPGIAGSSFFGPLRELAADPLAVFDRLAACGDVASQRVGLLRMYMVKRPEHIRHVLVDHQRNYGKQTIGYKRAVPLCRWGVIAGHR
jgi:cytochrome P450